ncbi:MAG: hypothetical protein M1812_000357 [Candelaria pacifica]|nr:MAG: hypothetical protein M1812_000357 [Candelaria pacifica]
MGSIQLMDDTQNIIDSTLLSELKSTLKASTTLTPDSEGYAESLKRWSESVEKKAGAVVLPTTAEDISATVLFSKSNGLEFVICGGGHSTSGASSSEGGIVINLAKMRRVSVDAEGKTITAQGGALWKNVDEAAAVHGLATVGGTVNHTGIGGLTLGGGYGWLAGQYGLVIDNLLKVQVVLADGRIVIASETENQDLFWAMRGAGSSFGVATEFTYKAYEQKDPVWTSIMAFTPDKLEAVVEFANQVPKVSGGEAYILITFAAPPPMGAPMVMAVAFYNGPAKKADKLYAPLKELGPVMDKTSLIPYSEMNGLLNDFTDQGDRKSIKGSTFLTPLDPKFVQEIFAEYTTFLQKIPDAIRSIIIFEFFSTAKICEIAQTETAFANRGHYQNILVSPRWTLSENDDVCRTWSRHIAGLFDIERERVIREDSNLKDDGVGQYGNYDSLMATPQEIFGVNYQRLRMLKTIYDPENAFSKAHAIVPAVKV